MRKKRRHIGLLLLCVELGLEGKMFSQCKLELDRQWLVLPGEPGDEVEESSVSKLGIKFRSILTKY